MGIWIRKRSQQERIDNTEDCCCCPNPQRQGKHCDGSEAGILAEHSCAKAQVLPTRRQKRFPAGRADDFLRNFETPPLQAHGAKRILAAHPLLYLFFGRERSAISSAAVERTFNIIFLPQLEQDHARLLLWRSAYQDAG